MKKYFAFLLTILLLIPCRETQAMNHIRLSAPDKMALTLVGVFVVGYGVFRFLIWWKPKQPKGSRGTQRMGTVTARGNVSARQIGSGSMSIDDIVSGGDVALVQRMESDGEEGSADHTMDLGNIVSAGDVSVDQSGGNNRISGPRIVNSGSVIRSQGTNNIETNTLLINAVSKIKVLGNAKLHIFQINSYDQESASITAQAHIIEQFGFGFENDMFTIGPKKNSIISTNITPVYTVRLKNVASIELHDNITALPMTHIHADKLSLKLFDNAQFGDDPLKHLKTSSMRVAELIINAHDNSQAHFSIESKFDWDNGLIRPCLSGTLSENSYLRYTGSPKINLIPSGNASYKRIMN